MPNLLDRIKEARNKLNNVQTRITLETGDQIYEKRNKNGEFTEIPENNGDDEPAQNGSAEPSVPNSSTSESSAVSQPICISNRRKKAVERKQRFGFVVDLKPDLELANVTNGLYLGSQDVADEFELLKSVGITHVINVASSVINHFPNHLEYLTLPVVDLPSHNIRVHFEETNDFIRTAITGGGKVLVHCNAGISRSTTIVLAYIMWAERKTLSVAIDQVRAARKVARPNVGFMHQLRQYAVELGLGEDVDTITVQLPWSPRIHMKTQKEEQIEH